MNNNIWFDKPTNEWEEGLPIGNGSLGAMILGQVVEDKVYLNEESIWYGGHKDRHNPDAAKYLNEVRALLFEGKIEQAETLCKMSLGSTPQYFNPYMPGGYLWMNFPKTHMEYSNYRRSLDVANAIAEVSYDVEGISYKREFFSTYVDQVIVIRLTASKDKSLSFHMNINRRPYDGITKAVSEDTILMVCECGKEGVEFATAIGTEIVEGKIKTIGNHLVIEDATEVNFYISTKTSFKTKDYAEEAIRQVSQAREKGYTKIKEDHISDYKNLFNRSSIQIKSDLLEEDVPTDERLEACKNGERSTKLIKLFYDFGRYLMIASSREGGLPSNLQGIWNMSYTPAWESNYTININTQMNYWPAEVTNLSSCHKPLFEFVERLCENGRHTAQAIYGCTGSVAHHISNIWADSEPGGILTASPYWPMGLAWLSLHMYEHYLFTGDETFLKDRCYPVLKEVATFYLEYLVESPDGYLVTGPSLSPENSYISSRGEKGALCMGPSMDSQIIKEVFEGVKKSIEVLGLEDEIAKRIGEVEEKLPPIQVGKEGQILEWYQELEEVERGHRHISHLFALHPGSQITESTPQWFKGAEVTLKRRLENGGGHTGWSKAWIINFYARLLNAEEAYENLLGLLKHSVRMSLLDVHPPFQIDGNFGACAAIAEMLVQSHEGYIRLLPACPKEWKSGEVKGLCARGGFEVDFKWDDSKLTSLKITSKQGKVVAIKMDFEVQGVLDSQGEKIEYTIQEGILRFGTHCNKGYSIKIDK